MANWQSSIFTRKIKHITTVPPIITLQPILIVQQHSRNVNETKTRNRTLAFLSVLLLLLVSIIPSTSLSPPPLMASIGICYGGGGGGGGASCSLNRRGTITCLHSPIASLNVSSVMSRGKKDHVISMSVSRANNDLEPNRKYEQSVSYENVIDKWMKESVVEIVKNLREAPLLVHVYSDGGYGDLTRLKTEKAAPEEWPMVKLKWEDGTTPLPEGVIFVEQLKEEDAEESEALVDFGREGEITRAWGIVVQAKGKNCGPACYLLKTSRAESGSGMGLCCTHFCLVKLSSFRETAEAQFKNCWLLNGLR